MIKYPNRLPIICDVSRRLPKIDKHKYLIPDDLKSDAGYLIVNNTLIALQKWASFHRGKFNFPVLSISGSYGKTVIKEWINFIAEEKLNVIRSPKSYNSQFGAALTLLSVRENHQLAIVETGISKPGEMSLMKKMHAYHLSNN